MTTIIHKTCLKALAVLAVEPANRVRVRPASCARMEHVDAGVVAAVVVAGGVLVRTARQWVPRAAKPVVAVKPGSQVGMHATVGPRFYHELFQPRRAARVMVAAVTTVVVATAAELRPEPWLKIKI